MFSVSLFCSFASSRHACRPGGPYEYGNRTISMMIPLSSPLLRPNMNNFIYCTNLVDLSDEATQFQVIHRPSLETFGAVIQSSWQSLSPCACAFTNPMRNNPFLQHHNHHHHHLLREKEGGEGRGCGNLRTTAEGRRAAPRAVGVNCSRNASVLARSDDAQIGRDVAKILGQQYFLANPDYCSGPLPTLV